VAGLALGLAALEVLGGDGEPAGPTDLGVPVEALLLPAATGAASVAALHLVPVGLLIVLGLAAVAALTMASIEVERRILARPSGPTAADRTALLSLVVPRRVMAFTGWRRRSPVRWLSRSRPAPGRHRRASPSPACPAGSAGRLRCGRPRLPAHALRAPTVRARWELPPPTLRSSRSPAAALRAMGLPRLLGPDLLTLVLYLWSAYRGVPRSARRDASWVWEVLLLAVLGAVVVAWNLIAQG